MFRSLRRRPKGKCFGHLDAERGLKIKVESLIGLLNPTLTTRLRRNCHGITADSYREPSSLRSRVL